MTDETKRFELSAKMIKMVKKSPTNEEMLKLYGLYKQATIGDCNIAEPNKLFNYKENTKWNSWNSQKGLTKLDAMSKYSDIAIKLIDKYGIN